jgi:hypothetical protein
MPGKSGSGDRVATTPVRAPSPVVAQETGTGRSGGIFVVDFHRDGNSAVYRTHGWSGQEATYIWSVRGSCGLRLPAPVEPGPLVLEADFAICLKQPVLNAAVVRVFVNGHLAGAARATGRTMLRCRIPQAAVVAGEGLEIRFEHPCFVRLDRMAQSADDRALGLCFYSVRLFPPWLATFMDRLRSSRVPYLHVDAVPVAVPDAGDQDAAVSYGFGANEADQAFLRDGWTRDQDGGAWTNARVAALELPAPSAPGD